MQIKKVDPEIFGWSRENGRGKYRRIYQALDKLKIGEAIEVRFGFPNRYFFSSVSLKYGKRNSGQRGWGCRCKKLNKSGSKWALLKVRRPQ